MQHLGRCHVTPAAGPASEEEREWAQIQYLALAGLGCPNCANRVRNTLLGTVGVVDVEVDLSSSLAVVWFHPQLAGIGDLVDAVSRAGEGTHHRYLAVPLESQG